MRAPSSFLTAACCLLLALAPGPAPAESAAILLDGFFQEWTGGVEHTDPAGDGTGGGIDLRAIDLANDDDFFFLRFETTVEISLQEINSLVLYLDTDQNAATGTPISGIGAELRWRFGARQGTFYTGGGSSTVFQDDIRLRQLPSVTSPEFEVAIGRDVEPDGTNLLFTGSGTRVLLRHEVTGGDQAPDVGQILTYVFDATPVPPPAAIALPRETAGDLRVTTWNVVDLELGGGGWDAGVTPSADRVLSAIDPDVLCFQEIYDNSAAATATLVEGFLPSGPGEAWYARENSDVIVVSRFPVLGQWNLDGAAGDHNLAVLLDTQAAIGRQLLLVGAHFFCCTNDAGREAECDRIMSFFGDAKSPGGALDVPAGTMLLVTGDLNLVGNSQQLRTLLTGDIVDEATFGPDVAPDWDGSPLADLVSSQTERRFAYTWRNDFGSYAPGRLDFFIYSDSVVTAGNHFLLYTPEMTPGELATYGLQAGDVTTVSDHLPHTADFRDRVATDAGEGEFAAGRFGSAWATLRAALPGRERVSVQLALGRTAQALVEIYDVRGARVARLRAAEDGLLPAGTHLVTWDGRTASGARAAAGTYVVRLVARDESGMILVTSTKLSLLH
jgi:hypothetical protein